MLNTLNKKYSVSVVGCTGLVGSTLLDILQTSNLPLYNFNFYASKKSVGKQVVFKGEKYSVKELTENFETADFNIK